MARANARGIGKLAQISGAIARAIVAITVNQRECPLLADTVEKLGGSAIRSRQLRF
jgi:hypothetical protein